MRFIGYKTIDKLTRISYVECMCLEVAIYWMSMASVIISIILRMFYMLNCMDNLIICLKLKYYR